MALRLPDRWLWDFWLAQDGPDYHIFYLQAARSLGREELRHWHVSIGHAISHDLRNWEVLPDALRPSSVGSGAWDDYTTWTGSIIRHASRWHLFYTGAQRAEEGLVQRIGLATSEDLIHWQKHPASPLIEADPRWYELLDLNLWHDQAWRDPHVLQHPQTGEFHALITARANVGPPDGRGVIGHAVSQDLLTWQVRPPVVGPGDFGYLEVPQWLAISGRYYLVFSASADVHSARWRQRTGRRPKTGTYCLVSDEPLGPYRTLDDAPLVGDEIGSYYSGKLVQDPGGNWQFLAWRLYTPTGEFIGDLPDPMPVKIAANGKLSVSLP
jgi:beta-fructofuranosidase